MHLSTQSDGTPVARWKVAAIPVLALVLAALLWPTGPDDAPESATTLVEAPLQSARAHSNVAIAPPRREPLPPISLQSALQFNPFFRPAALTALWKLPEPDPPPEPVALTPDPAFVPAPEPEPEPVVPSLTPEERQQEAVARVQLLEVSTVLLSARGNCALVGDRVIHPGDWLEEGVQVVAIDTTGLTVRVAEVP